MKSTKIIGLLATVTILGSSLAIPGVVVHASEGLKDNETVQVVEEVPTTTITVNGVNHEVPDVDVVDETSNLVATPIYRDAQGNEFTKDEVLFENPNPVLSPLSIGVSPISIGVLWTYTTKADGTKLRNMFRNVAVTDLSLGAVAAAVTAAGIATAGIGAALGLLVAGAGYLVGDRFNEGANLIASNPNSGKIYMYVDHVTYKK